MSDAIAKVGRLGGVKCVNREEMYYSPEKNVGERKDRVEGKF